MSAVTPEPERTLSYEEFELHRQLVFALTAATALGFVAGFSERFVPDILVSMGAKAPSNAASGS